MHSKGQRNTKQYGIQLGTIWMETICHMGATCCVFERKKGSMFKKNKKAKRETSWGEKKNPGAQFVVSDKDL